MNGISTCPPLCWLFLDMNSYFASVEQSDRPELRGKPVGVIPVDSEYSCCIAASAEAKRQGIKTGTRVAEAKQRCPEIALVLARPAHYIHVHGAIQKAIERHLPIEKAESVDEFAMELLGVQREPTAALALGRAIQQQIIDDVGACLTSSVGIAPSRLLAKIASEVEKPNGLVILNDENMPERLCHFDIDDLTGIGRSMAQRLRRHGIDSVEQLWQMTRHDARHIWGSVQGLRWWDEFHGVSLPRQTTRTRSMGHAHILPTQFRNADGALAIMNRLLHKAAARLREGGYVARRLHASVGFTDRTGWGDQIALPTTQDTLTIVRHLRRLWDRPARRALLAGKRPQRVGVDLLELLPIGSATGNLFTQADAPSRVSEAMDRINAQVGSHAVHLGGMLGCRKYHMDDKIAFGRVPGEAAKM